MFISQRVVDDWNEIPREVFTSSLTVQEIFEQYSQAHGVALGYDAVQYYQYYFLLFSY